MQVTGWTYWDNEKYENIGLKRIRRIGEMSKGAPKMPNREDVLKFSEEEINEMIKAHSDFMDKVFNAPEITEYNKLLLEMEATVIKDVRKNGYHFTGDMHQNMDNGAPIIDDKYVFCVSQRSWGQIIADAFPEEFEDAENAYVKWAWYNDLPHVFPSKELTRE